MTTDYRKTGSSYYLKSPSRSSKHIILTQKSLDRKQEKLHQKIYKLKTALKSSSKHNQELHEKLKKCSEDNHHLKSQIKRVKKVYDNIKSEKEKLGFQNEQLKMKLKHEQKNSQKVVQLDKLHLQSQIQNKKQLQQVVRSLKKQMVEKQILNQQMSKQISLYKERQFQEKENKYQKLERELHKKTTETQQLRKQVSKLKQSMKDLMSKTEKHNQIIEQKVKQNRRLQLKEKQGKIVVDMLEKQNSSLKENKQKASFEFIKSLEKISEVQKKLLQSQYEKKNIFKNLDEAKQYTEKLKGELSISISQYEELSEKHQEALTFNYELQKDMERQLHTIAKQLYRRHKVSESLTASTICPTPHKSKNRNKQIGLQ